MILDIVCLQLVLRFLCYFHFIWSDVIFPWLIFLFVFTSTTSLAHILGVHLEWMSLSSVSPPPPPSPTSFPAAFPWLPGGPTPEKGSHVVGSEDPSPGGTLGTLLLTLWGSRLRSWLLFPSSPGALLELCSSPCTERTWTQSLSRLSVCYVQMTHLFFMMVTRSFKFFFLEFLSLCSVG